MDPLLVMQISSATNDKSDRIKLIILSLIKRNIFKMPLD